MSGLQDFQRRGRTAAAPRTGGCQAILEGLFHTFARHAFSVPGKGRREPLGAASERPQDVWPEGLAEGFSGDPMEPGDTRQARTAAIPTDGTAPVRVPPLAPM